MPSLPEPFPRLAGEPRMLGRKGYDVKSKLFAQGIEDQTAGRSFSGENDGTGLKNGKGTDPSLLRAEYQS